MKIKLLLLILVVLLIPSQLFCQSATYSVKVAKFSSDKSDEFSPVYYRNGIVFCSNRNKSLLMNYQTPDNKSLLKINFADTLSGKVRLFSNSLKTRFNDGPASFSRNDDTIYFSRNLKVDGALESNLNPRNKLGIFTAVFDNNDWTKILDLRFNNEYYNITTPSISYDGKRLFFASDNPAGYGGTDLYSCEWKGDYWDDPVNMGPEINTSGNESYPFVNREGGLFFSSDGHSGLGGKDIFYTKQLNNKWLKPVPLDPPINSKFDDFAFVADSAMGAGYFSTRRGSSVDIYSFKTNYHQLFYCDKQRENQYCFKFTDETKIAIDDRFIQVVWSFGDGTTANGLKVEHCYKGPGNYSVKLDAVDKKTGKVIFSMLSYNLELRDIEQPVITSPGFGIAGEPVTLNGISSNFGGSSILNYTWEFGDNERATGEKVDHVFSEKGDYDVKLGLTVRNDKTGVIKQFCSIQQLRVFSDKTEKALFDKRVIKPAPVININDYDHAVIRNMFSAEKNINQDGVYRVEIVNSKSKLSTEDKVFKNVPKKYTVKEEFLQGERLYSYYVDEEMNFMSTYQSFSELAALGFANTRVISFNLEDPAEKELNNIKKVFGVSTDLLFKRNDFSLTSSGTQILDLVIGFMSKYPAIKLEVACHTDNMGTVAANQTLTQKRAEAMVTYLVINGVSSSRLSAKGYGGTRPIATNYPETDRRLNRRVDFTITGTTAK